jgi:uncharacterized membrane protein YoaK (UPF0700 family)
MLAASAGFVVVVGYIVFNRIETGGMTGNTIAVGAQVGGHGSRAAYTRAAPIPAFVVGVAAGVAIAHVIEKRRRLIPPFSMIVAIEIALLTVFMLVSRALAHGSDTSNLVVSGVVALPAFALGLQTAAMRRVNGRTVRTTFITGMLTRFAEEAVFWVVDRRAADGRRVLFLGALWMSYGAGAAIGAVLMAHWSVWSLFVPIGVLSAAAITDAA